MKRWCLFNNDIIPLKEAKLPIMSNAFQFGEGAFTVVKIEAGKPIFFDDHIKRLNLHARAIGLKPVAVEKNQIDQLVVKNKAFDGVWKMRMMVVRGEDDSSQIIVILNKESSTFEEVSLCVYPYPILSPLSKIKTNSYLHRYVIHEYARQNGYDDCISIDDNEYILEVSRANVFWITDNVLYYPAEELLYMKGVTLSYVIKAAHQLGMKVKQTRSTIKDISINSNVYICSTLKEIIPVCRIGKLKFPQNTILKQKLQKLFCNFK